MSQQIASVFCKAHLDEKEQQRASPSPQILVETFDNVYGTANFNAQNVGAVGAV